MKIVKGQYGRQGECKTIPYSVHMRQIVIVFRPARVSQLISQNFLCCSGCSHAFHPDNYQGNKRKISLCCTVRFALLKTMLKKSTVKKIHFLHLQSTSQVRTESGYDHGCDDARISDPSDQYINQPEKGPAYHTPEFMDGY